MTDDDSDFVNEDGSPEFVPDLSQQISDIDGVHYTTVLPSGTCRVVFEHEASTAVVDAVKELVGDDGRMGSTQEHLPYVEFDRVK